MKVKTSAAMLALVVAAGGYAIVTATKQDGVKVVFNSSWYVSDYERRTESGAYNATGNWYIASNAGSGAVAGKGGQYRHTTFVAKPGHYIARFKISTASPTKLNCKITAGGRTRKEPPGADKNPGTGTCSVSLEFAVGGA